jgi:hypothetical protein
MALRPRTTILKKYRGIRGVYLNNSVRSRTGRAESLSLSFTEANTLAAVYAARGTVVAKVA